VLFLDNRGVQGRRAQFTSATECIMLNYQFFFQLDALSSRLFFASLCNSFFLRGGPDADMKRDKKIYAKLPRP
jgi:hypothetical protein